MYASVRVLSQNIIYVTGTRGQASIRTHNQEAMDHTTSFPQHATRHGHTATPSGGQAPYPKVTPRSMATQPRYQAAKWVSAIARSHVMRRESRSNKSRQQNPVRVKEIPASLHRAPSSQLPISGFSLFAVAVQHPHSRSFQASHNPFFTLALLPPQHDPSWSSNPIQSSTFIFISM